MTIRSQEEYAIGAILDSGWVRTVDWQTESDSTNAAAKRWLSACLSEPPATPALFVADVQTAGRGRGDHVWWSPSGCLMLTLAIDASCLPEDRTHWSQLALVCGLAVGDTIDSFVQTTKKQTVALKWPNDVYLGGKKCAGILIESGPKIAAAHSATAAVEAHAGHAPSKTGAVPTWLIGIGLNVNIDWSNAPSEVAARATSIDQHSGDSRLTVPTVLVELTERLHQSISEWTVDTMAWRVAWQDRCLLTGKVVRVAISGGETTIGLCEGVDASGRLLVRDESGLHEISSGEVLDWQ